MGETLEKLRPDRDLQCFFQRPSAVAALSETSPSGFTISGSWRQQFDWVVIEWNRDNVYEHPLFRNLPDGDLSGLTLIYDETRTQCIAMDSDLFPTVDWPTLRVWADDGTGEKVYKVPLKNLATAIEGSYRAATVSFTLGGTVTAGDFVGLAFLTEHYPYQMNAGDTVEFAIQNIVAGVNAFSPSMHAVQDGAKITLSFAQSTTGANGNRIGAYTFVSGSRTEQWDAVSRKFSGGTSPTKWRVTLPFGSLADPVLGAVPAQAIRKMRWTYAADLQSAAYVRSEFQVVVSNWTVTGSGLAYKVAGPGSRRMEDAGADVLYSGPWSSAPGNFSGGTIHSTSTNGASVRCTYLSAQTHTLFLVTRAAPNGATVSVVVDGQAPITFNLAIPGEDVLVRKLLGQLVAGQHTVVATHTGATGTVFFFDAFELAVMASELQIIPRESTLTLATDWDTDHSIALGPERTAWIIHTLGFGGRVNHYAGALWFYELVRQGHHYASATVTFTGTPDPNLITRFFIARTDQPLAITTIEHLNLIGDTVETLAIAFALEINRGYTAIRAQAAGGQLSIFARAMGADGNALTLATSASTQNLTIAISGATFSGGVDGDWRTDLAALPRINRAARDWSRSFYRALAGFGIGVTCAFSMELQHGDPSAGAGIAQRYPSQAAVLLNTPALQTNFSPQSTDFWKQVYRDMAQVQVEAGIAPFLQFGEVQWWYFPDDGSGLPFYDAYTTSTFRTQFGRDMQVIHTNTTDPATASDEASFLPGLIGAFTNAVMAFVRATYPACRFEVLYPTDVNAGAWNRVVNYPHADWTPQALACLKTESFTYTFARNLDASKTTIEAGVALGFPVAERSHLVGIEDANTAWLKEARMAEGDGFESVVLFALDQFCLVGYPLPMPGGSRRSAQFG